MNKRKDQRYNLKIRQLAEGTECPEDEFRFTAEVTNKDLDGYFSSMDDESLDNCVKQINDGGLALLNGHNQGGIENILGKWISAERQGDKVIATASMLRSNENTPENLNVDEYIRRIEKGYIQDVSVGFYGHRSICNLCDDDMFDWTRSKCNHWPGKEYDGKTCTYEIKGAKFGEVSLVFDGANDSTQIMSMRNAPKEILNMKQTAASDENLSELELIGRKYKNDLIDKMMVEGVRALGNDFDEDSKRKQVETWSIDAIQQQTAEYEKVVPFTGGRKTGSGTTDSNQGFRLPSEIFG